MAMTKEELTLKATPAEAGAETTAPSLVKSVTAQELGMEPAVQVPAGAEEWRQGAEQSLLQRVERYAADMNARHKRGEDRRNGQGMAELGSPIVGTYVALDVLSFSPIQQITFPPYEPSRIIAGGESAVIWALVFINPAVDVGQGFAIPATVQLGGRQLRVSLDQVNLTTVTAGPNQVASFALPSPAPAIIWVPFVINPTDPGPDPALFEANVTVDISDPAQPYAAFATHHVSVDADPGFLGIPPEAPNQLLNNIPMRYLVFSQ
jgi:hypothetical protein